MNIGLTSGQIALVHIIIDAPSDGFELYGGTQKGAFQIDYTGSPDYEWLCTIREADVVGKPLETFNIYARELSSGREWVILSGKIVVKPRTANVPADKLHPVEYFITVPVRNEQVDAAGNVIVQGIPGPKGDKGEKGEPGEGGITAEERALLMGAAQRDADNTFTAGNTFTGAVDMSGASVTPPEGWNVGELTPEAIQQVVPIAWFDSGTATANHYSASAFGVNSYASTNATALGTGATAFTNAIALGYYATTENGTFHEIVIGQGSSAKNHCNITVGSNFGENVNGSITWHKTRTEGTGSITIGAGANTLNNGDTESSNSVTIGCKAENKGADSVVIGASSSNTRENNVAIGAAAKATDKDSVAIGKEATATSWRTTAVGQHTTSSGTWSTAIGAYSLATQPNATALGMGSRATAKNATAVGYYATAADVGVMVFRSDSADGTYTQLYFSGANTPLANTYENGEAMMGYVVRDSAGNVMTDAEGNAMVGTQKLSVLFPNNRGENAFTPAMLGLDDEWTPKPMFRPSDLDMPTEEPTEPEMEVYQPLPVYPIVEPEIEPLTE